MPRSASAPSSTSPTSSAPAKRGTSSHSDTARSTAAARGKKAPLALAADSPALEAPEAAALQVVEVTPVEAPFSAPDAEAPAKDASAPATELTLPPASPLASMPSADVSDTKGAEAADSGALEAGENAAAEVTDSAPPAPSPVNYDDEGLIEVTLEEDIYRFDAGKQGTAVCLSRRAVGVWTWEFLGELRWDGKDLRSRTLDRKLLAQLAAHLKEASRSQTD